MAASLERIGWHVLSVEVDLVAESARMELRCGANLVTFDARNGAATTTREVLWSETVVVGRRGDRCRVDRLRTRFIGRERHEGMRSGLRWLAGYIAENGSRSALPKDVRDALRLILTPQLKEAADAN